MARVVLEEAGYEVLKAQDGQEGLESARKEKPDIIILDVMLPKMDGYNVCRMLKFDDKHKNIPIIMFTAKTSLEDEKTAKEVGANGFLTKNFDPNQLLDVVKKHLEGKV